MDVLSFSRLNREEKIHYLREKLPLDAADISLIKHYWFSDEVTGKNLENISENVLSHYVLPYSIAPGFIINQKEYFVPMVTEESSVVAAAASAAKFWSRLGGFTAKVISKTKIGQIHFNWKGNFNNLLSHHQSIENQLNLAAAGFISKMKNRGGGILGMEFMDYSRQIPNYFQLVVKFDTVDAMGANIINTCLESMAIALKEYFLENFEGSSRHCDIVMSILSNYTPDCLVESSVSCKISDFNAIFEDMPGEVFANRFKQAVDIAKIDKFRAVTHNKGIYNGIDAVLLATGNDFRATAACGHAYASDDNTYKSLTDVEIAGNEFKFILRIPLAIGTIGGLTGVHPLVRLSLKILNKPNANELMQITATVGLANNFSAIRALITSGIQKGHMKFHLFNLLQVLNANDIETAKATDYFKDKTISKVSVEAYLKDLRK